jgi:hypothetical protein
MVTFLTPHVMALARGLYVDISKCEYWWRSQPQKSATSAPEQILSFLIKLGHRRMCKPAYDYEKLSGHAWWIRSSMEVWILLENTYCCRHKKGNTSLTEWQGFLSPESSPSTFVLVEVTQQLIDSSLLVGHCCDSFLCRNSKLLKPKETSLVLSRSRVASSCCRY